MPASPSDDVDAPTRPTKRFRPAGDDEEPTCYLCLDGAGRVTRSHNAELLHGGCACCGSAGHGHLRCFVQAAEYNYMSYMRCPTCKQNFTGPVQLGLAQACLQRQVSKPAENETRLAAQSLLALALKHAGKYEEALSLRREIYWVQRHSLGNNNLSTLISVREVGSLLSHLRRFDEATQLLENAHSGLRRTVGDTDVETLTTVHSMVINLVNQGNFTAAVPILRDSLVGYRLKLGDKHLHTLAVISLSASVLVLADTTTFRELRQAEKLAAEAFDGRLTVLGVNHEDTQYSAELLRSLRKLRELNQSAL